MSIGSNKRRRLIFFSLPFALTGEGKRKENENPLRWRGY